jgi:hypothetical protein
MRNPVTLLFLLAAVAAANAQLFGGKSKDEVEDVWAIECVRVSGPDRAQKARNCAEHLRHAAGLKPDLIQTREDTDATAVYYGRYVRTYDTRSKKESFKPDPADDLKRLRDLSMNLADPATGRTAPAWPFRLAKTVRLAGALRLPQWELTKNPGYYSLQVGVFYNEGGFDQRKFAAEEYCRILREDDKQEAWYHHGDTMSIVTIGAFPKDAIQNYTSENDLTGSKQVTAKIVDPKMLATQKKYPHNLHNGATFSEITQDPKTGKKRKEPHYSFAVIVPGRDTAAEKKRGG